MKQGWHFTDGDKLRDGRPLPPIGEWLVHDGPVEMCKSGLHYSPTILDALSYAPGCHLHRVSVRNVVKKQDDKAVCRRRRIDESADMTWALVSFAENCATRAEWAERAAGEAAWAAWAAMAAAGEAAREAEKAWQDDTLRLYFECMKGGAA